MKKIYLVLIVIVCLITVWGFLRFFIGGSEDSWIKNEKGEYVKHGVPSETPDYVKEQQEAVIQALELYQTKKQEGMEFESQCLGIVGENLKYVVDIIHIPRTEEDNLPENQCEDYLNGEIKNFIELDKDGNIFMMV